MLSIFASRLETPHSGEAYRRSVTTTSQPVEVPHTALRSARVGLSYTNDLNAQAINYILFTPPAALGANIL